jgi:aspartate carbamoyltransferase catalytic subunit
MKNRWERKDLLGLEELSVDEINLILDQAESFQQVSLRPIRKVPTLRGKTIVNLFLEPSTRTRTSFELAAKRLSADVINITSSTSSIMKGETLKDTARNIEAMNVDVIVMRHSVAGAPYILAKCVSSSVINAGDGCHEHPTQALLDMYTIRQKKGKINGLNISIIGDISHSRVARSNIWGLKKLKAHIKICAPPTLIPKDIEMMDIDVTYSIENAIKDADVLIILRLQTERQKDGLIPSTRESAV